MKDLNEFESTALNNLLNLEKELTTRLDKLTHDRSQSHSADSSEQAVERENDEVMDQLESETRDELLLVKNAINRIYEGKYTTCSKCGNEISQERLEAVPYTTLCIACAE